MILSRAQALCTVGLLAFAGTLQAAGFQVWEQSSRGLGTAFAGSAAQADHAGSAYYNPASMTGLAGTHLSAGVTAVGPRYRYRGPAGTEGAAAATMFVPNYHLTWQAAPDWHLGLSITTPFALDIDHDPAWPGAAQALQTQISTVNVNPSLAYRASERVALGLGVNLQRLSVDVSDTGGRFEDSDEAVGWNAGVLFTLSPRMRVGVAYRSTLAYDLQGGSVTLPDTLTLSVWQQVSEDWEAMGDLSYTRWHRFERLAGGDYDLRDSWRFAWGAAYRTGDASKLKFGIAYERSPVRDAGSRLARLPEADTVWLTLGGQWSLGRYGMVDVGYAYLMAQDPHLSLPAGRFDIDGHRLGVQYAIGY